VRREIQNDGLTRKHTCQFIQGRRPMDEQETSPIEADSVVAEKKGFWTIDRIITYSVLSIAVIVALNDYRVRNKWESDFEELFDAVTVVNTPGIMDADNADAALVQTIRSGTGVSGWMADRGYAVDDSQSSEFELVFSTSSGIRTFFVNVDIRRSGKEGQRREEIILVSRDDFYAWNARPGNEKETMVSENAGGAGSGGEQQTANMGGGEGQRGGGGRSFDPEQIFADRDKDKDGLLSGDEISERMQPRIEEIDEDQDGAISKDEFLKAIAAVMASRQQRGGGSGVGGGGGEAEMMSLPDDPYEQGELGFPDANALPEDIEKLKKELDAGQ
jgi:hypothetical protein